MRGDVRSTTRVKHATAGTFADVGAGARFATYAIEAFLLGTFMVAACVATVLVEHPASLVRGFLDDALARRALLGLAMGATAIALIHSPWGRRSGAHFNPAVTIAFCRLSKIRTSDAAGYVLAQCAGGVLGVLAVARLLGERIAHPAVSYAITVPGAAGVLGAFAGEVAISFVQMGTVLLLANGRHARHTGLVAGALVATWITFEAPLSGMSMNPARTLASAYSAGVWTAFWIYVVAPLAGMLLAAEAYVRVRGVERVLCAKLRHDDSERPCLFRCAYCAHADAAAAPARTLRRVA